MNQEEKIKILIEESKIITDARTEKKILGNAFEHLEKSKQQKSPLIWQEIWRIIMRNRMTKLTTAAIIFVAVLIGINMLGGKITSVTWAEVADLTAKVPSVMFRMTNTATVLEGNEKLVNQEITSEAIVYLSTEYGSRADTYANGKLTEKRYRLAGENVAYLVHPNTKSYLLVNLRESERSEESKKSDPREWVKEILSYEYKKLGRDNINNIDVEGVEIQEPLMGGDSGYIRLWVDVKTSLPVRIESVSTLTTMGNKMSVKTVFDEFQWNINLNLSIFKPDIPDNYEKRELNTTKNY